MSWRGRYPSAACSAASRGKSAYAVFAAMVRMSVVAPIVARYSGPRPSKAARASCEITVSCSEGTAPISPARKLMPRKRKPRIPDIHSSVIPALRLRGSLNAGIPFEIASTPVRAVVPLENAWRIRKRPMARTGSTSSGGGSGTGYRVPSRCRTIAVPTVSVIIATKKNVGTANTKPDSFTPRRLTTITKRTSTIASITLCSWTAGKAEATWATPEEIETATVRM